MMPTLDVVATPIGNLQDMTPRAAATFGSVDFIAAEDTRVTLKLLNHLGIKKPMVSYYEHNAAERGTLIIDRIHMLDILGVTITHKPDWGYFRVSVETMVGSGAWIFIPPIMQLITPTNDECVRFFELFELIGDALVNNSVEEENVETD